MPDAVAAIAPYVPTHEWMHLVLALIGRADHLTTPAWAIGLLAGWAVVFAGIAHWAFRRDEGVRYG
jgi:ABC-2 type transport system permease protein